MYLSKKTTWQRMKEYQVMYIFLLPAIITVLLFSYLPLFGLIMAFQEYDSLKGFISSPFVGFDNFINMFKQPDFWPAVKNTVGMNFYFILFGFPLPIIFALMINEIRYMVFKRVTQTITYLPHFISWVVIAGLAYKLLEQDYGAINLFLNKFGIPKIDYFKQPELFWGLMVFLGTWKELGWNSIIYLAALASINQEQYEAAKVDGATRFQNLIYVTLPGIYPVMGLIFIFTVATIFGGSAASGGASFDAVYNLGNAMLWSKAQTLDYHIYIMGIFNGSVSYATAVGLVLSILSLTTLIISNKIAKKISGYGAF